MRVLLFVLALSASAALRAQPLPDYAPDTTATAYGTSSSVVIRLDEYGFGLGTAVRARLTPDLSFSVEAAIGAGKDAREQQFFVGFFGDRVTPLKRNNALLLPVHLGLEQRLFRRTVESNFRPYAALSGGPVVALQWPYFEDVNGDGIRAEAGEDVLGAFGGLGDMEARLGVGGSVALGAYFGRGTRRAQGLRFAFIGHYFPAEVDLLELAPEVEDPSRAWFITPVVSYHLVRLID
ncbi:MAG: hypothetical protein AAGI52_15775 [Bacteroidota bacterium]